jgi:MHS family proline/betaine transporter-like MFS transporter
MLFPSLGLALLPSYSSIGYAAPLILLLIRLVQGAAAGGELVGSILFIVESAPDNLRGLLGAFCFTFAIVGTMMGTLAGSIVTALLDTPAVESYGWRLAFVFGFMLGLSGVWLRRGLEESEEFMHAQAALQEQSEAPPPNPLKDAVTKYPKEVFTVVTVCSIWCCGFYTLFIWIGTLYGIMNDPESAGHHETDLCGEQVDKSDLHISPFVTPVQQTLLVVLFPAMGYLSDRLSTADRRLRVMFGGTVGLVLTVVPLYALLQAYPSTGTAMFVQTIWAVCMAAIGGPMSSWFIEFFPPLIRYCAVGIGYNFSQAIFGGSAPLIATALISCHCCSDSLSPMVYVTFVCGVSACGAVAAKLQLDRKEKEAQGLAEGDNEEEEGGDGEAEDGCPTLMSRPGPLLGATVGVAIVVAMGCFAAKVSTSDIEPSPLQQRRCESLEGSFCRRTFEQLGECPMDHGCIEPHRGHDQHGECVCAGESEGGGAEDAEEAGAIDILFLLTSLAFTALGGYVVSQGRTQVGAAEPAEIIQMQAVPALDGGGSGGGGGPQGGGGAAAVEAQGGRGVGVSGVAAPPARSSPKLPSMQITSARTGIGSPEAPPSPSRHPGSRASLNSLGLGEDGDFALGAPALASHPSFKATANPVADAGSRSVLDGEPGQIIKMPDGAEEAIL